MATLDFYHAFDTIDHEILLLKLKTLHCSPSVVSWFKSYSLNRQQYVLFNGISSDTLPVTHGTTEYFIMAPVLFLIYNNNFQTSLPESDTLAYADDLTLIASDGNANMVTQKL